MSDEAGGSESSRLRAKVTELTQIIFDAIDQRDAARNLIACMREDPDFDLPGLVRVHDQAIYERDAALTKCDSYVLVVKAAKAWAGKFPPRNGGQLNPNYFTREEIALVAAVDSLPGQESA